MNKENINRAANVWEMTFLILFYLKTSGVRDDFSWVIVFSPFIILSTAAGFLILLAKALKKKRLKPIV